jgi:hypothetical protein
MKRNLPAVQKDSLARVKNNLDILNKLINIDKELQIDEQGKRIIAFFSNNSEAFILSISRYYPLSYSLIEKYQDIWDWLDLTVNKNINWPLNFLEKYSTKLHLPNLFQKNKNLIWSDQLINIGIKQLGKDYFIHCIANYTDFKWSISFFVVCKLIVNL